MGRAGQGQGGTAMALQETQRGVLRGMLAALATASLVLLAAVLWPPGSLVPLAGLQSRIAAALQWEAGVLVCLVIAIGSLARHRFFTPADIDGRDRKSTRLNSSH